MTPILGETRRGIEIYKGGRERGIDQTGGKFESLSTEGDQEWSSYHRG